MTARRTLLVLVVLLIGFVVGVLAVSVGVVPLFGTY
jgi:F0F1-type ATP synthase assembly protein I